MASVVWVACLRVGWLWVGWRFLSGKPGSSGVNPFALRGGPPDPREGFNIKRRSRTIAGGMLAPFPPILWVEAANYLAGGPPYWSIGGHRVLICPVLLRVMLY